MGKYLSSALVFLGAACGDSGESTATAATSPTQVTGVSGTTSGDAPTTGGAEPSGGADDGADASNSAASSDGGEVGSESTGTPPCGAGHVVCDGDVAQTCDGMGGFSSEEQCEGQCEPGFGCVACIPGTSQCDAEGVQVCNDDGTGWQDAGICDPLLGLECDENSGTCVGACAQLGTLSYIGCEYYAVTLQQYDIFVSLNNMNPFAVAISNAAETTTMVTITRGDELVAQTTVDANKVQVMKLPWVDALILGQGPSKQAKQGAYRIRSTQPVTVYQFSPLNSAESNDASLLLPVNTWSDAYWVASWPHWADYLTPGEYTVTASQDNTTVHLKGPPGGTKIQKGGGVDDKGDGVALLNTGDVLQVLTGTGGDVTGSFVSSDKPVQVIAGHECTQVPFGVTACDHLEETMFPLSVLSNEYIVVPPVQTPDNAKEKAMFVRIVATEDDTQLTFEPDQAVDKDLATAGEFVEIPTTLAKFKVTANHKILVAQFMIGQDGGYGTSDPSMLLAVPSAQYRHDYLIYAQPAWTENFVDIIAPDGATVTLDGGAVGGFVKLGGTGYSLAHAKLMNTGDGNHTLSSNLAFGLQVSGVQNYGSYWYPGGLDLALIPPL
jgi:hypothetical protein